MGLYDGPSDHFLQSGYSHRCVCGRLWYDSDGGPCHWECVDCGKMIDEDDSDDEGRCWDCHHEKCQGCGEDYEESYLKENDGFCEDCIYDLNLLKEWPDDELALHLADVEKFTCKQAIEKFEKRIKGLITS
jgi:hypothetical protein